MHKLKTSRLGTVNLQWVALAICAIVALPVLAILQQGLFAGSTLWQHLWDTVLTGYLGNSFALMLGVAFGVLMLGIPSAWLISMCRFPGQRWLSWLLLLPLAMPAYIIAYTYTGILDFAGPVQSWIRELTGLGYGQYWFWEIRSLSGAIVMLSLVLYPYVYLTARATFYQQSSISMDVARSLGYSRWQAVRKVALPMARPAIIAGLSLALMETLADYGTVQYFGVPTFTTGMFRMFYGYGDAAAASQLAMILLAFVLCLLLLEQASRRKQSFHVRAQPKAQAQPLQLTGWHGWAAFVACSIPVTFGFLIPAGQLAWWTLMEAHFNATDFIDLAWNSFSLAAMAAVLAVSMALLLAYARRYYPKPLVKASVKVASLGYAMPGTIIAIGVLLPATWLDQRIYQWFTDLGWGNPGLLLSGTLVLLLLAYCVRFLAVAMGSVQSGLGQINPSLDQAGRSLGHTGLQVLGKVHVPLMRASVLTAILVVFVDVLKELPATLMLRPFDFNTLAVKAYELAADEQLIEAAPASLLIVLVGLVPVLILNRAIGKRRV